MLPDQISKLGTYLHQGVEIELDKAVTEAAKTDAINAVPKREFRY